MFDRTTGRFTLYDLPTRGLREWLTVRLIGPLFQLINWGVPLSHWLPVDRIATGTPLPYGIDITPDGKVWFARLHTDEIGVLDPDSGEIRMIATPFTGPRRLRSDAEGNLWIAAFPESAIARYEPKTGTFTRFDLPVLPKGSDTPYSLNVDRGAASSGSTATSPTRSTRWISRRRRGASCPLPRRVVFTRDIEFARTAPSTPRPRTSRAGTSRPQPTLIRVQP